MCSRSGGRNGAGQGSNAECAMIASYEYTHIFIVLYHGRRQAYLCGVNALGALATSTELQHFERQGLIVPLLVFDEFKRLAECSGEVNKKYFRHLRHHAPDEKIFLWDKNVIFFPRRINGKLYFLHRIRPGIQIVAINHLQELTKEFWENYFLHLDTHIVMDPQLGEHEASY